MAEISVPSTKELIMLTTILLHWITTTTHTVLGSVGFAVGKKIGPPTPHFLTQWTKQRDFFPQTSPFFLSVLPCIEFRLPLLFEKSRVKKPPHSAHSAWGAPKCPGRPSGSAQNCVGDKRGEGKRRVKTGGEARRREDKGKKKRTLALPSLTPKVCRRNKRVVTLGGKGGWFELHPSAPPPLPHALSSLKWMAVVVVPSPSPSPPSSNLPSHPHPNSPPPATTMETHWAFVRIEMSKKRARGCEGWRER